MAYITPQQIFQQLLIEREQAVRREFAVYRGEVEDDGEFERAIQNTDSEETAEVEAIRERQPQENKQ